MSSQAPVYIETFHKGLLSEKVKTAHEILSSCILCPRKCNVDRLSGEMGIGRMALRMGLPCGIYPLHAHVVTEIDALETLFPVRALHVTTGGVGVGAAAVSLLIEGDEAGVRDAFALVETLKDEADVELAGRA